jgi:hypothetical protein
LKNLETANHAWEAATANRWVSLGVGSPSKEIR